MGFVDATVNLATTLTGSRETRSAEEMTDRVPDAVVFSAEQIAAEHRRLGRRDADEWPEPLYSEEDFPEYVAAFKERKAELAAQSLVE